MKLLVLSDLHLEFSDLALPAGLDFDVAVLAGDIVCPGSMAMVWAGRPSALRHYGYSGVSLRISRNGDFGATCLMNRLASLLLVHSSLEK